MKIKRPLLLCLRLASITTLTLITSGLYCLNAVAQSSSATLTTDPELSRRIQEANARKAVADAERAAAEAEKAAIEARSAAFKANLPTSGSEITALGGTITVDEKLANLTIEAQILTYEALSKVLPSFLEKAKNRNINLNSSKIIIQDDQEVTTALDAYNTYRIQAESFVKACESAGINLKPLVIPNEDQESVPLGAIFDAPTEVLKSIANLLSLFNTNTQLASVNSSIEPKALVAKFAATLNDEFRNVNVYYPKLFSLKSGLPFIVRDLDSITKCQQDAQSNPKLSQLSTQISTFVDGLRSTSSTTNSSPQILIIAKGARLKAILNSRNSFVLYMGTTAGGTNRVTRNLFTGTKLRHSGGVILYYALFDSTGSIKLSDVDYFYTGFKKVPIGNPIQLSPR